MSNTRVAAVLGAAGSVGKALMKDLIGEAGFKVLVTFVRSSQVEQVRLARDVGVDLRETIIPTMTVEALEVAVTAALRTLGSGEVVGLSTLGVGAGTAKLTLEAHRAIDVELNAAFARGLKASGRATHLAFMSAVGADIGAATTGSGAAGMARYARVKGEAEEAVKKVGLPIVSIFRPAMIIGSRHTPWLLEKIIPAFSFITPGKYRSITVEQIAKAMVACSRKIPAESAVYYYPDMVAAELN